MLLHRVQVQKGVSSDPIFLRFHSPNVPNLSLVDLPGAPSVFWLG